MYEGKLCYWVVESMTPDEVSFVNIPADSNAIVVEVQDGNKDQQDGPVPASNGNIVLAANASLDKKLNENAEKMKKKMQKMCKQNKTMVLYLMSKQIMSPKYQRQKRNLLLYIIHCLANNSRLNNILFK